MKSAKPCSEILDRLDDANSNAAAALAIIDCVRVLCSLERLPEVAGDGLSTGRGYAYGNVTRDDSMSIALYQAMGLIEQVNDVARDIASHIGGVK